MICYLRVSLEQDLAVLADLLLAAENTVVKLDGVVFPVQREPPQEELLGSRAGQGEESTEGLTRRWSSRLPAPLGRWV